MYHRAGLPPLNIAGVKLVAPETVVVLHRHVKYCFPCTDQPIKYFQHIILHSANTLYACITVAYLPVFQITRKIAYLPVFQMTRKIAYLPVFKITYTLRKLLFVS